jgi:hypothetical protein
MTLERAAGSIGIYLTYSYRNLCNHFEFPVLDQLAHYSVYIRSTAFSNSMTISDADWNSILAIENDLLSAVIKANKSRRMY